MAATARRISPAAWQNLHFLGHYAFRGKRNTIDLAAILAMIDWARPATLLAIQKFRGFGVRGAVERKTGLSGQLK